MRDGKRRIRFRYTYDLELFNSRGREAVLQLKNRIPVSRDERILVRLLTHPTGVNKADENGILLGRGPSRPANARSTRSNTPSSTRATSRSRDWSSGRQGDPRSLPYV